MLASTALAGPIEPGERLEWTVRWLGATAGTAWAEVSAEGDELRLHVGCVNAAWLDGIYPIRDTMISRWRPASGGHSYTTEYHEGRFEERQHMAFATGEDVAGSGRPASGGEQPVLIRRELYTRGTWVPSELRRSAPPGAEDPVSAVYRLRAAGLGEGDETRIAVFDGRKTLGLLARGGPLEVVNGVPARRIEVRDPIAKDDTGALRLWLTEDEDAVPVQAAIDTRAGVVWLTLARREDPSP